MNIDRFWDMVDKVHAASPRDMKVKCTLLANELRQLHPEEIKSFDEHFREYFFRAYTWDIWGAAFVIGEGCSDDSFMDFRSTLISLGRTVYETALTDADALAQFEIDPAWAQYEGYQYVCKQVYTEVANKEPECDCAQWQPGRKTRPQEPAGIPLVEWEMSSRLPRLAAKYGFADSDWLYLKIQKEKEALARQISLRTARLLLQANIIPPCGRIPPFRIVADVLKSGRAPQSTGNKHEWEPYELEESHYWSTVVLLETLPSDEKNSRPELADAKLALDVNCRDVENFDAWMASLKQRGLT